MNIIKKYWILDSYLLKLFNVKDNVILFNSNEYRSKHNRNKLDNNLFNRSLYTLGIKDSINKSLDKQFIYSSYFSNIMSGYVEIIECELSAIKDISSLNSNILCLYSNTILFIDKLKDLSTKQLVPINLINLFSNYISISNYNNLGVKTFSIFNAIKNNK